MTRKHTWPIRLLCLLLVLARRRFRSWLRNGRVWTPLVCPGGAAHTPFTDVSVHAWYYPYVRVQHTLD